MVLNEIWTRYGAANSLTLTDFDILLASLRSILLKDPELQPFKNLKLIMALFEKVSYIENHKVVALSDYSIKMYFQTAERLLSKIYLELKKIKSDPTHIRYPGLNHIEVLNAEQEQRQELTDYSQKVEAANIRFLKEIMFKLGTTNNVYTYIGDLAFEFKVSIGYPPEFEGKQYYIRHSDIYWEIPTGIFSGYPNVASSVQQVYILAIKWFANPNTLNGGLLTQKGTNITSLILFDGKGNELLVKNLTNAISIVFPYAKTSGYDSEFLKCQYYDTTLKKFSNNGCGHAIIDNVQLPCTTCAVDNSYLVTTVFSCR